MQMPTVVEVAQAALKEGKAVVVGLQSTGEAAADAMGLEPGRVCGFISTAKELLTRFVATHFPTFYQPSAEESASPKTPAAPFHHSVQGVYSFLIGMTSCRLPMKGVGCCLSAFPSDFPVQTCSPSSSHV